MNKNIKSNIQPTKLATYSIGWVLVFIIFLLDVMRTRAEVSLPLLSSSAVLHVVYILVPYFLIFIINNNLLIPRYLLQNKYSKYFSLLSIVLILFSFYFYFKFAYHWFELKDVVHHRVEGCHIPHGAPGHHPHPIHKGWFFPIPLIMDMVYALLVIGLNTTVALLFQRVDDRLDTESLKKANAENQLIYLRQQINPHFYMNMLNNIHGLIEIDPEKAQAMLLDMSRMMRYMLYESPHRMISLHQEVDFLKDYIRVMKMRYADNRVTISVDLPDAAEMHRANVPPSIFVVFIENAFKHGISYNDKSFIEISLKVDENIKFTCINSAHQSALKNDSEGGIGLANVKQRISLIYGDTAKLNIDNTSSTYCVNLELPKNENENNHH